VCCIYFFQRLWYTDIVIYPWLTPKKYWSKKYYIQHHLVVFILRIHIQEIIDKIIESGLKKDSDNKIYRKCIQWYIHILENEYLKKLKVANNIIYSSIYRFVQKYIQHKMSFKNHEADFDV